MSTGLAFEFAPVARKPFNVDIALLGKMSFCMASSLAFVFGDVGPPSKLLGAPQGASQMAGLADGRRACDVRLPSWLSGFPSTVPSTNSHIRYTVMENTSLGPAECAAAIK